MEMQFERNPVSCRKMVLWEVQNLEQTQELRLDAGAAARVLGAWGQCLLRSKQWQDDRLSITAGMRVFVLYEPEEGQTPVPVETWIPFQAGFDLPRDCPEGKARILCMPRSVEARPVSAGKLVIRCGMSVLAQAWVPMTETVCVPAEDHPDVELLRSQWPVELPREAGEKIFSLEEDMTLPPSVPEIQTLVYCRGDYVPGEKKVLGSKLVFRGTLQVRMGYLCREGQLHSWDQEIPVSQFVQLDQSHSTDASAEVWVTPAALEIQLAEGGIIHITAELTAQYVIRDRLVLDLTEDAYSPVRQITPEYRTLELPVVLESRSQAIPLEVQLAAQADVVADVWVLPELPRIRRAGDSVVLEQSGVVQALWYGPGGQLRAGRERFCREATLRADPDTRILATLGPDGSPAVTAGEGNITVSITPTVQLESICGRGLNMITGIRLGEALPEDPDRPSLVLRRAGKGSLWETAKAENSTVEAIRRANNLEGDPIPGQVLLIPAAGN